MRHAVYFAPLPDNPLHLLGSRWLGRDALTGELLDQPDIPGIAFATNDPRRYGFHATLKPPFSLRKTISPEALMRAVAALAAHQHCFDIRLKVALLDGFLALVPDRHYDALQDLADSAVRDLDGFRCPPSAEELARRRAAGLSQRQERCLAEWGYPFVFEDFRFHLTLSERLSEADAPRFAAAAEEHFAAVLAGPMLIDGLSLFEEVAPDAPFLVTGQFPFAHPAAEVAA